VTRPYRTSRRQFIRAGVGASLSLVASGASSADRPRLLLVHGRDQQGKNPAGLKSEWLKALEKGAREIGRRVPSDLDVAFPFYGDALDAFTRAAQVPLTADIRTKGSAPVGDFLAFQAEVAEELRVGAGVTDTQINEEYGRNPKPKGPQNWEWVQAILRALDEHGGGINQDTLETFTRDVYLYTRRAGVRAAIDKIVADTLSTAPTVVVAHSLGSVVAYSVLTTDTRGLRVPLLVTVGSPLAVRAIRDEFRPLAHPTAVSQWYNAYDDRDVVALYPLDDANFPVAPAIANFSAVKNHTKNRHGIVGYLDDPTVAKRILDALDACT
jgi:hypothetical protein